MPNDTAAATLIFIGTSVSLEPTQGHVPPEPTRHATLYRTRAKPSPARGGGSGFRKRGARHSRRRRVASFKATSVLRRQHRGAYVGRGLRKNGRYRHTERAWQV